VITMREIDVQRAVLDAAREAYRCAFRALERDDDVSPHRFGALLDAVDRTEAGVKTAEAEVEAALRQWWAQDCRAAPPKPFTSWAAYAGDLAGRLENVRRHAERWQKEEGSGSIAASIAEEMTKRECATDVLKEIDAP
jgi:hypothetical protein